MNNSHTRTIDDTYALLRTGPNGLDEGEAAHRLREHGPNELAEGKKRTPLGILLAQFADVMILILLAAALISGIIGDLSDTIVILVIVVLNALVGFLQEYRAEKAMAALKQMASANATVRRNGSTATIPAAALVPGDLVLLEAGNAVPADLRLVESFRLKVDEAPLTGESETVEKITEALAQEDLPVGDRRNLAFKGSFVAYGRGTGIVVATGMQTELGRIAQLLQKGEAQTPLQQRMASFGKKLSFIVLFLCLVFFVTGWLRGEDLLRMVMTSISLAVAAIPEALPAVITISLALAARRMILQQTLIRKLPAVETLGSVTYICTDKTGTLTRNKMHVEEVFVDGLRSQRDAFAAEGDAATLLLLAMALNNDAEGEGDHLRGDPTETALLEFAQQQQLHPEQYPRVAEVAFDSERKLMTTFHAYQGRVISFTKGAPDVLLRLCSDPHDRGLQNVMDEMAADGMRVLGFACRYWNELPITLEEAESDLEFLGLAGLIDPPREDVMEAVTQCRSAGITPVMITGDHPLTARTIASRIGLMGEGDGQVLTGQELGALPDEAFAKIVEQVRVYARVSPEQKLRIVTMLQQKGHFVAMTGDGVNDAPSLKSANIGIAMGITGTDVSKEAAHMILLDDRFSTIVRAVREGRRIYDNILKFIKYLMTTNSGELWTLLIGPIIGLPIALLPIHILWVNLVSDGLPAIALSFEKAEPDIMKRPPRAPKESVFSEGRGWHIIWVGLLMAAVVLGAQAWSIAEGLHWQTIVFNVVCLSQMAHVLAIRSERRSFFSKGMLSNPVLIIAVLLSCFLQFLVTYVPFLQKVFHTEALSWKEFLLVGALSSIIFFAVEIEKAVRRR